MNDKLMTKGGDCMSSNVCDAVKFDACRFQVGATGYFAILVHPVET